MNPPSITVGKLTFGPSCPSAVPATAFPRRLGLLQLSVDNLSIARLGFGAHQKKFDELYHETKALLELMHRELKEDG